MPVVHLTSESWTLTPLKTTSLLEKLQNTGTPFGQYVHRKIHRGIVTGCEQAFVIDTTTREDLISENINNKELIKPWIRGGDILKWKTMGQGEFVITIPSSANKTWPWSNAESKQKPREFLLEFIQQFIVI